MTISDKEVGFYFVNGILSDDPYGSSVTQEIQTIIQSAGSFQTNGKAFVTFHPNFSTPAEKVVLDIFLIAIGTLVATYAINKEIEKKGDASSRALAALGICALVWGFYDYNKIQQEKNAIATNLAGRVSRFLNENPANVANLILHSQGADIGYRALEMLQSYKTRIRAMTLGGMVTIPNSMCSRVTNYKFSNDLVSRAVAAPFEEVRKVCDQQQRGVTFLNSSGILTHGVREYLKSPLIKQDLAFLLI
jgi:hypothetical protein